jgi:predicted transcriptional regulator
MLETLGVNGLELRTYQFLLKSGGATAGEVARQADVSRGHVYRALETLVERGLARSEPAKPIRYTPVPFAEVVHLAIRETERKAEELRRAYATVAETAPIAAETPKATTMRPTDVRVVHGRRAVHAEIRRMLGDATRFFLLRGAGRLAERLATLPDFLADVQAARTAGRRVEIHLTPSPGAEAAWQVLDTALGSEVVKRAAPTGSPATLVAVSDRAVAWVLAQPDNEQPNRGEDVAVLVHAPAWVHHQLEAFRLEGILSPPATGFAPPVGSGPGEPLSRAFVDRYLEAVQGAREEVLALGMRGWSRHLGSDWHAALSVYAAARRRGVRFRGLVVRDPAERPLLDAFRGVWDIREVDWVPAWLVIIDGKELFQAVEESGGRLAVRHTRQPADVGFYRDFFERIWTRAG